MDYRVVTVPIQSAYQPYTTKTYRISKTVKNVDLGYNFATTKAYPVTSYINDGTPIYKTGETFTTTNYIASTPVPISYQKVSAPILRSVTIDKQVATPGIQPKLATKYVQVPATTIVPIEQSRTISLVPLQTPNLIPTTSLIKIPQPSTQQLSVVIPQPSVLSQPMVTKVVQVPLAQSNHIIPYVKTQPVYENSPIRLVKSSILSPKQINTEVNDFRSRTALITDVDPFLGQIGVAPGVNTHLLGFNTGGNTGFSQIGNNLNNGANNLTNQNTNQLNNAQNNLNKDANNFTPEKADNVNDINNTGTDTLDNAESDVKEIEHGKIENYVKQLNKEKQDLINKLF